jgi:hypothetical protein
MADSASSFSSEDEFGFRPETDSDDERAAAMVGSGRGDPRDAAARSVSSRELALLRPRRSSPPTTSTILCYDTILSYSYLRVMLVAGERLLQVDGCTS